MTCRNDTARQPRDPGLQPERTTLAWRRTTLSALTTCLAIVHLMTRHPLIDSIALLGSVAALTLAFTHASRRRSQSACRRLRGCSAPRLGVLPHALTGLITLTGLLALAGLLGSCLRGH